MKKRFYSSFVCGAFLLGVGFAPVASSVLESSSGVVYALDNFGNGEDTGSSSVDTGSVTEQSGSDVSDALKGYKPVDSQDIENARQSSAWLTDLIGIAISFLVIGTFAGIGLITALDMLYLAFPPVRNMLYTAGTDGTGGMSGMNMSGNSSVGGRQWVSDEAVQVASMLGGSAQANGHGSPMSMGMPNMGMHGSQASQVQQGGGRVAIGIYLRKRVTFLVLLGVASVLLFTSAFTDFGINVGGMLLELLGFLSEKLSNISIG